MIVRCPDDQIPATNLEAARGICRQLAIRRRAAHRLVCLSRIPLHCLRISVSRIGLESKPRIPAGCPSSVRSSDTHGFAGIWSFSTEKPAASSNKSAAGIRSGAGSALDHSTTVSPSAGPGLGTAGGPTGYPPCHGEDACYGKRASVAQRIERGPSRASSLGGSALWKAQVAGSSPARRTTAIQSKRRAPCCLGFTC